MDALLQSDHRLHSFWLRIAAQQHSDLILHKFNCSPSSHLSLSVRACVALVYFVLDGLATKTVQLPNLTLPCGFSSRYARLLIGYSELDLPAVVV